ncbi:MAG: hypothetical protein L3K09_06025 [Thermoplasmata archaeon]|nr:hypothetical protein [Thermoplasmata archaeon]
MRLPDVPKYIVLEPGGGLALTIRLDAPACEIDVRMENEGPRRSFVLMIGHPGGPFVQRVRLSGRAKIYFDPGTSGEYLLLLSNPMAEPVVLRLLARNIPRRPKPRGSRRSARREAPRHRIGRGRAAAKRRVR